MRIISILLFKCDKEEPTTLAAAYEVGFVSYFQRGSLKEFINFNSRLVASRTAVEDRLQVVLEKGICYSYVTSDKIGSKSFYHNNDYYKYIISILLSKYYN